MTMIRCTKCGDYWSPGGGCINPKCPDPPPTKESQFLERPSAFEDEWVGCRIPSVPPAMTAKELHQEATRLGLKLVPVVWPVVMTVLRHKFPLAVCLAALSAHEVDISEFEDLWRAA